MHEWSKRPFHTFLILQFLKNLKCIRQQEQGKKKERNIFLTLFVAKTCNKLYYTENCA